MTSACMAGLAEILADELVEWLAVFFKLVDSNTNHTLN